MNNPDIQNINGMGQNKVTNKQTAFNNYLIEEEYFIKNNIIISLTKVNVKSCN